MKYVTLLIKIISYLQYIYYPIIIFLLKITGVFNSDWKTIILAAIGSQLFFLFFYILLENPLI